MRTEIFVQARMGSTRLPGKALKIVDGKTLLEYQIERLREVKLADHIMVLTTMNPADEEIVKYCLKIGVDCFRGDEEDVLARYYQAALARGKPDSIVRITSDCPLIDPEVTDEVIEAFREEFPKWDYISNTFIRTYPRGLDVEIFSFSALEKAFFEASDPSEREHVTLYIYRNLQQFRVKNIACPALLGHHRWTVDTQEDFDLIERLLKELNRFHPHFRLKDVLSVLETHPEWSQINAHIEQKKV